ncbi:unnamed protein product [Lactuca virosa]|uniref:Uncharacterized protein n=1 Tax=Lactuca virosa TaxID=75947 RepID=A0AAU9LKY4_9ASTR|nr:unnamed protein product [Lactuca virosa]
MEVIYTTINLGFAGKEALISDSNLSIDTRSHVTRLLTLLLTIGASHTHASCSDCKSANGMRLLSPSKHLPPPKEATPALKSTIMTTEIAIVYPPAVDSI